MKSVTPERISEILNRGKELEIAVVGDLMLDVYLQGSASRLSPEAPVPILNVRNRMDRPGGAANVMRNLKSFGSHASAFGITGNDPSGETLRNLLSESGIDTSGILCDSARRTTEKLRALAGSQQLVRLDFEDVSPVAESYLCQLGDTIREKIRSGRVQAVIFEDYAKGLLRQDFVQDLVDEARRHGVYTSLDPHPGHPMVIRRLSLMTPNRNESFGLAGMYCQDPVTPVAADQPLRAVAGRILNDWQADSLLITLGAQGMALFKDPSSDPLVIPTKAREVFDVSGAGDTVIAAYTLCCAAGAEEAEAAAIANYAAGVVVGKVGTATASPEEILQICREDLP